MSGSQRRGILVANNCGRFLSYLAVGLGAVMLLRGGGLSGAWLMLLGWFGLGAARNQSQMLVLQQALNDLRVRDAARRRFRVLEAGTSLRDLSRLRIADLNGTGSGDWLLVCDRGRWQGYINDDPLQQLPIQRWDSDRVGDHIQPLSDLPAIAESAPLWQAVQQLEECQGNRLLVLSPAGLPSGTLEKPELGEAVLARLGLRPPAPLLEAARRQNTYPLGLALPQVVRSMMASGEARQASAPSR
jgi:hypothetical protein